jgi:MFS family permease
VGRFVLPSAVPIILFALLFFVLLAVAGVVLLSLALRYRAGTARRQGRRWVASLNVWMTSLSAVLFLSFSFLISFWLGTAFRFALIGMGFGAIVGLLSLAMTRWESQPEGLFYTPKPLARASRRRLASRELARPLLTSRARWRFQAVVSFTRMAPDLRLKANFHDSACTG